jgi:uncharacterized glyoxalase superfamily protein PhnB
MTVNPIPKGYHSVTPYLVVNDAAASLSFLERAFGAQVKEKVVEANGRIGHAALLIGNSMIMLGESNDEHACNRSTLYVYVPDVDAVFSQALAAGGKLIRELADQPYGDRNGGIEDADGNRWYIGTHMEHVSDEEIARRYAEIAREAQSGG